MAVPRIRPATIEDAPALAALRWAWSAGPGDDDPERFAREFAGWMAASTRTHRCTVAESGDEVVGMAWIAITGRPPGIHSSDRRSADLQSVYVLPGHRATGVGERLVRAALEMARGEGAEHVTVHATPEAAGYYERFGFEQGATIAQLDLRG